MSSIAPLQPPQPRQPRVIDRQYKAWIARLPCVRCGDWPVEVAHVRYGDALFGKPNPGMQVKPDDLWTLPLCAEHHRIGSEAQHNENERHWWQGCFGPFDADARNALTLCLLLRYCCYPDEERARGLLHEWRAA